MRDEYVKQLNQQGFKNDELMKKAIKYDNQKKYFEVTERRIEDLLKENKLLDERNQRLEEENKRLYY